MFYTCISVNIIRDKVVPHTKARGRGALPQALRIFTGCPVHQWPDTAS